MISGVSSIPKTRKQDPVELGVELHEKAVGYCSDGKPHRARPLCLRALKIFQQASGPNHPDVANILHTLGTAYEREDRYRDAERSYTRALGIVQNAARDADVDRLHVQILTSLAGLYRVQARYAEAEPLYFRTLKLAKQVLDPHDEQMAAILNNLAIVYKYTARFNEAVRLYRRALRIIVKALGPWHPEVASIYHNLGGLEHSRGRFARGEPYARRSVKIRQRALGRDHVEVAADVAALAALLDGQKKYKEAERLYRRALAIFERAYGRNHYEVAVTLNNLAALYQAQGDGIKPERLYRRALAIKEKALGPDHPDVAMTLNNLGLLYKSLGRLHDARPCYERALAIFEKSLGASHPKVATSLHNYAHLLEAQASELKKRARQIESDLKTTASRAPRIDARHARFRLDVRPSRIHRWGVFAEQTIPAGQKVIEYTGERIARREAKRRARRKLHYLFQIDKHWKLDGAVGGSGAEFINHCCSPNLISHIRSGRVFYYSTRRIRPGEELLIDYRFSKDDERVPCHCGAANCRGTINEN
jgi:tetratricopeptide (TPR) repeat protein